MPLSFTAFDWTVLGGYVTVLALAGYLSSRRRIVRADQYFLASHKAPTWLVAVSVLSTVQSAATFLGVPDNSYRGDYAYLAAVAGPLIAAFVVGWVLIPRFYAARVSTVYELLEVRFGTVARRAAGVMYLVGRILASGARLYLAAIAVSMIMFLDIEPEHIVIASFVLLVFGLAFTFMGGLNSIIWSDLVQVVLYLGAALTVLVFLWTKIPASPDQILTALSSTPEGVDKLRLFDFSFDLSKSFSVPAILTGLVLLNIGNSGLDQDTTQRLLACDDARSGRNALIWSVVASIPVILIFLMIGSLLYVFYQRPDLMMTATGAVAPTFQGEKITVFMHFILSELPPGVRGLVTVGVIAAAAVNSGLISMSAVAVNDFYRPWAEKRGRGDELHFVRAGRAMTILLGFCLFGMSILCYYWQRATSAPLLDFVLGVMAFAYAGLLGVYFTAVFTRRGSSASVVAALIVGFLAVTAFQPFVVKIIGLPVWMGTIAFPWQLTFGAILATLVCLVGRPPSAANTGVVR
ncbi:MAG: sodium:solute symporter [Brevundimonas sp. 12-68-7]|uniref:Sodium:solute symporter n=1 Tax=Brevundimonas subvibrioides TaxID=74313 RepID=A0A258FJ69_9CAUL|nr:MAG: sodium:solute symporter [Brevundimonas sp. 12-68-7]OYX32014.1 MAG: sodium:solute symporter [Brevundimonas subvibrioides]